MTLQVRRKGNKRLTQIMLQVKCEQVTDVLGQVRQERCEVTSKKGNYRCTERENEVNLQKKIFRLER